MKLSIVDEKNEKEPIPPVMILCALQLGVLEVGSKDIRPSLPLSLAVTASVTATVRTFADANGGLTLTLSWRNPDPTSRTPNWSAHGIITGGIGSFSFFSSTMDNFIYN